MAGFGPMGRGIGRNIVDKGWPLAVLGHHRREPIEYLVGRGAQEVGDTAALAAASDIVLLCLPSSRQVEELVLGPGGLAETMRPGQVLIDSTTAEPASTERIATILAGRSVDFLDAPLTRTAIEAEAGRLNVLVGGEAAVLERVRPLLSTFAENIFHIGPIGTAHKLKLINNFLSIGHSIVAAEAIVAARKLGVDVRKLTEVVSLGGANSAAFQMLVPWALEHRMAFAFSLANASKDLGYFVGAAESARALGAVGTATSATLRTLIADGHGDRYMPELIDLMAASASPSDDRK
jgi:3-hydroxyisobutyrate dehydrogenase-like beta-hydroxyacid dehydrogenase